MKAHLFASKLNPLNEKIRNALAQLYVEKENWSEAIAAYQASLKVNVLNTNTRLSLAGLYVLNHNYDEAIRVLSDVPPKFNTGTTIIDKVRLKKQLAIAYALRARESAWSTVRDANDTASLQRLKDFNNAVDLQLELLEFTKHKFGIQLELGALYRDLDQSESAVLHLERALLSLLDDYCSEYSDYICLLPKFIGRAEVLSPYRINLKTLRLCKIGSKLLSTI